MTNKEAIKILQVAKAESEWSAPLDYQDAFNMAIDALEKQVQKKAVLDYGFPEKLREVMIHRGDKEKAEYKTDCCPVCKHPLGISQFVKTQTGKPYGDSYCKRCGQKILWED